MDLFLFAMQQLAPVQLVCRAYFLPPANPELQPPDPEQPEEIPVTVKPPHSSGH